MLKHVDETCTYVVKIVEHEEMNYDEETLGRDAVTHDAMRSNLGGVVYQEHDRGSPFLVATFKSRPPSADHEQMITCKQTQTAYTVPICVTDVLEVEVLFGDFETNDHRIIIRNTVAILVRQLEFMKRFIEQIEDNDFSDTFMKIVRQFTSAWQSQTRFAPTDADLWRCRTIREYAREDRMDATLPLWIAQGISGEATKIDVTAHGSKDYAVFQMQTDMQEAAETYHFQDYKDVLRVLFGALIKKVLAHDLDADTIAECKACVDMINE
ncbi:hypothetical protein CYMTET_35628 [Cymbomonas tetramitiformis]|uniref:Uncharacterized protein n=1 Tax=Cymbomonas tetramitiformis TaxID=36881 RepID=A0AAE0KNW4_9CHLO|nr:hypothetical protein CYMTET_35628 [Cymbomonas tetramitiformis]